MPDYAVKTTFTAIDKITPAFARMSKAANSFDKKVSGSMLKAGKSMTHAIAGGFEAFLPALGIAAVVEFGNKCIEKFGESEAAIANVEAGLRSTHHAIGLTTQDFEEMAKKTANAGIIGKTDILQNATAKLLMFGNIGKDNFERVQNAAVDLAVKMDGIKASGESVKTAAMMLGKAFEDPVRGMAKLRKSGVMFSDQEEKTIKNMVAMNNVSGAQAFMLSAIEKKVTGTNKALSLTSKGMERMAQNKLGATMVQIGEQLEPMKAEFYELLLILLPIVNTVLPPAIALLREFAPIILGIVGAMILWKIAVRSLSIATSVLEFLQMTQEWGLRQSIKTTKLATFWTGVMSAKTKAAAIVTGLLTGAQWMLNIAMSVNPYFLIAAAIVAAIVAVVLAIKYWHQWGAALTVMMGPLGIIVNALMTFKDRWDQIKNAFSQGGIMDGLKEIGFALLDMVLYPLQEILELASHIPGVGKYAQMGADKIKSFREGSINAPAIDDKTAPNQTEIEARNVNNTRVNLYNANPGSKAEVTPKNGAIVTMDMGFNSAF